MHDALTPDTSIPREFAVMPSSGRQATIGLTCGLVAGAALVLSGCTVCQNARRTIISEPWAFSSKFDRNRSLRTYTAWAHVAWADYCHGEGANWQNDDFAAGFEDGFVDFVYAGGDGEPPPVPPRDFWNVGLRTGEGHDRANAWFAGYRQGAATARDGGYREQATVHSALRWGAGWDLMNLDEPAEEVAEPGPILAEPLPAGHGAESPQIVAPKALDTDDAALPMPAVDAEPPKLLDKSAVKSTPKSDATPAIKDESSEPSPPAEVAPPAVRKKAKASPRSSAKAPEKLPPSKPSEKPAGDSIPEKESAAPKAEAAKQQSPETDGDSDPGKGAAFEQSVLPADEDTKAPEAPEADNPFGDIFGDPSPDEKAPEKKGAEPADDGGAWWLQPRPVASPAVPVDIAALPAVESEIAVSPPASSAPGISTPKPSGPKASLVIASPEPPIKPATAAIKPVAATIQDSSVGSANFVEAIESARPAAPEPAKSKSALGLAR